MKPRHFPGHIAWGETRINGDHALAFIAIQPHGSYAEPRLHQVYDGAYFARPSEASNAAKDALSKLLLVEKDGRPVFSSAEC
ncbi:hypothetical protein D3879_09550 [Pseudomonas cavernicola]|uniref:Uncharacterized protein n=1 Tax=Pseudomonas cavernicola TaxID=2320866 RepID=A0A418XLX4_9PSED|nr:hypothetical protein [Pseudomonas cavernicola]RJG13470.1 hypothetical protein D3879_09550 [Pseudomonas cavernicola]